MPSRREKGRRVTVACPSCRSRIDVSHLDPGRKFRCPSCRKLLLVPRTAAPPSAPTDPGSALPPEMRFAGRPSRLVDTTPTGDQPVQPGEGDPLLGSRIDGRYELVRTLGEGAFGTVYEGRDLTDDGRVAVKLMRREYTGNRKAVGKFQREARTAAKLSHPNAVRVHRVGFADDLERHYLAMEFVEGRTLDDITVSNGPFPLARAVDVVIQVASGLGSAHVLSIIHRDIKPGNILLMPNGVVKITDFGLAKVYDPDAVASTIMGTPYFMPPEQFDGRARDGRTDIYALGVTFYYLLTQRRPFEGRSPAEILIKAVQQEPVPITEHDESLPEELWIIIRKMLARDLTDRYQSCDDLIADLVRFQSEFGDGDHTYCPQCGLRNPATGAACDDCGAAI